MRTPVLLLLLFTSNAFSQQPIFSTPFTWSDKGHVMVDATINQRWSLAMAVDTGAAYAVLPEASITALDIDQSDISSVRTMTATDTRTLRRVNLDSISIQDQSVANQNAVILDLEKLVDDEQPVGVLPFTYLNKFNVLFDFEKKQLGFFDRSVPSAEYLTSGKFEAVPFTSIYGFIRFELAVNGVPMQAILDTGASGLPLMNWSAANAIGITKQSKQLAPGREVTGAGKTTIRTSQVAIRSLTIGAGTTQTKTMDILDMPHFEQMIGDKPAVNVGLSRLGLNALLVDYENQTLHFSFG